MKHESFTFCTFTGKTHLAIIDIVTYPVGIVYNDFHNTLKLLMTVVQTTGITRKQTLTVKEIQEKTFSL